MRICSPTASLFRLLVVLAGAASFTGAGVAQDSSGVELHAKGNITAADVGLPAYPGATPYKKSDSDSGSGDVGFSFGDIHFRVVAAEYTSGDSPAQILDFYRKPLARYGEVLECDHGKPVGAVKSTRSGLTCSESGHVQMNEDEDASTDHELRAGSPHKFRIVGIGDKQGSSVRFGLVYVELPKESDSGKKSD
jgi:hypothetical protein